MKAGFIPALGTPLDKEGNLVTESYKKQIEDQIQAGAAGILCMGSMGIQPYLKTEVYPQVAKAAVEAADRKRFEFVNGVVSKVEKRKVEVGINNNVMTEIRSGLTEGEKVVATEMTASELADRLANPRSNRRR